MATLATNFLTLADWAKRLDPDGTTATVVDLLSQTNEMMEDMLWTEGNETFGYRTTVRTGLPSGTWRQLYAGVVQSKSTTAQIVEQCGNLEGYSTIDKSLADLNGNTAEFRATEDASFFEGMTQQMQAAMIYENSLTNPERIMGFAPRYNTVNTANAATANNVIDAGGTGSTNTSIWIVGWGPNSVFGIFPKGQRAGLMHEDLGRWTDRDGSGNPFEVYRSHFQWMAGLCIRDWRYVVRICNIDVTTLSGSTAPNLINMLVSAMHRFPTAPRNMQNVQMATRPAGVLGANKFAIYCNRQVASALDRMAMNKTNVLLKQDEWDGKPVTTFRGVPIRTVDRILNTEARIT